MFKGREDAYRFAFAWEQLEVGWDVKMRERYKRYVESDTCILMATVEVNCSLWLTDSRAPSLGTWRSAVFLHINLLAS